MRIPRVRVRLLTLMILVAITALGLGAVAARRRWATQRALAVMHSRRAAEWRVLAKGWDRYAAEVEVMAARIACGEPANASFQIEYPDPDLGRRTLTASTRDSAGRLAEVVKESRTAAASCRREAGRHEAMWHRLEAGW